MDLILAVLLFCFLYTLFGGLWIHVWEDAFKEIKQKHIRVPVKVLVFLFWPAALAFFVITLFLTLFCMGLYYLGKELFS